MSKTKWDISILLKVLRDLEDFLPHLVLVGGWVPFLYSRYLWKGVPQEPVMTKDIDFGFKETPYSGKETVTDRILKKKYGEHHVRLGHDFPFVPIAEIKSKGLKFEVEFITPPHTSQDVKNRLIGRGILINEIEFFDILLAKTIRLRVEGLHVLVPDPASFVFHKLLTFSKRRGLDKRRKDLYYAYFVLLINPQREILSKEIQGLIRTHPIGKQVKENLTAFFEDPHSRGPIMIDESARDSNLPAFIPNIQEDAFERIKGLI